MRESIIRYAKKWEILVLDWVKEAEKINAKNLGPGGGTVTNTNTNRLNNLPFLSHISATILKTWPLWLYKRWFLQNVERYNGAMPPPPKKILNVKLGKIETIPGLATDDIFDSMSQDGSSAKSSKIAAAAISSKILEQYKNRLLKDFEILVERKTR